MSTTANTEKIVRHEGGYLNYDTEIWEPAEGDHQRLAFLILDIYVPPEKRRQGVATQLLDTLFRRAARTTNAQPVISTGLFIDDGRHLIPTIVRLTTKYGVKVVK